MQSDAQEKVRLAYQLLAEALASGEPAASQPQTSRPEPSFSARCAKCGRPIHWAPTEHGKKAALDARPGPFVLADNGTAIFEGFGGNAYHYDGTPEGCPAQPHEEPPPDDPPRNEWQDIYDR